MINNNYNYYTGGMETSNKGPAEIRTCTVMIKINTSDSQLVIPNYFNFQIDIEKRTSSLQRTKQVKLAIYYNHNNIVLHGHVSCLEVPIQCIANVEA